MTPPYRVHERFRAHDGFDFTSRLPLLCPQATQLAEFKDELIAAVAEKPTELSINLALLQLQARYWALYESAPKRCKNHLGTREGHVCIFQVYREAYASLHTLQLSLLPPPVVEPKALPPPPPPAPQIAGIFLGEAE